MSKEVVDSLENMIIAGEELLKAYKRMDHKFNFERLELSSEDSREEYDELNGLMFQLDNNIHEVLGIVENMRDREKENSNEQEPE